MASKILGAGHDASTRGSRGFLLTLSKGLTMTALVRLVVESDSGQKLSDLTNKDHRYPVKGVMITTDVPGQHLVEFQYEGVRFQVPEEFYELIGNALAAKPAFGKASASLGVHSSIVDAMAETNSKHLTDDELEALETPEVSRQIEESLSMRPIDNTVTALGKILEEKADGRLMSEIQEAFAEVIKLEKRLVNDEDPKCDPIVPVVRESINKVFYACRDSYRDTFIRRALEKLEGATE